MISINVIFWFEITDIKSGIKSKIYKNIENNLFYITTMNKNEKYLCLWEEQKSEDSCYEYHQILVDENNLFS